MKTKQLLKKLTLLPVILLVAITSVKAQYLLNSDTAFKAGAANSGRLWGYEFSDFYFKGHSDSLGRGGSNQYTGIHGDTAAFQSRRIYLGYDYNITTKFSAELLLAAEDDIPTATSGITGAAGATTTTTTTTIINGVPDTIRTTTTTPGTPSAGNNDALQDNKLSFYIKLANLRWKGIYKGADLVIGQVATPSFPLLTEKVWNYRSIERTISDIRRTPSYDMGITVQGLFDPATKNFGYDVMIGNGTSAKPAVTAFRSFYGDVYGYFLHKKLVIDLYADYSRESLTPGANDSRQMLKGFIAYNTSATAKGMDPGNGFTIGVEGFINNLSNDLTITPAAGLGSKFVTNNQANGISAYIHGDIIKKKLRFFTRFDAYNPISKVNNTLYGATATYAAATSNYKDGALFGTTAQKTDETYKQEFVTAGLDYTPAKNVHFMPNIWYEHYASQLSGVKGSQSGDYDVVYRMTVYYIFGK